MTSSFLLVMLCLIGNGFSAQRRKLKMTFEEFRNSHDWNKYYNKTRRFYFDDDDVGVREQKSAELELKTNKKKAKNYDFPYAIPTPQYTLLKPKGFRIAVNDTGFIKWIQANVKYENLFELPYEYCVPAPLIADLQLRNDSWIYENTEYIHHDCGRVFVWFLVSTLENLVFRDMEHVFEIIEYIDGEMDINWSR